MARYKQLSPLGWRSWLVIYRTPRMAPGVVLGNSIVQPSNHKPYTPKQLDKAIRDLKKRKGWSEIIAVYEEGYKEVASATLTRTRP